MFHIFDNSIEINYKFTSITHEYIWMYIIAYPIYIYIYIDMHIYLYIYTYMLYIYTNIYIYNNVVSSNLVRKNAR